MDEPAAERTDAASESPLVPGREPSIRHVDDTDLPWEEFRRQRNADGSTSSVWEKWFAVSSDPPYLSIYARYDPGMIVRRHGHYSPHVVFVLEGELWVGDTRCPPGTHIELPFGAAFGPLRAGDTGAMLFEVMMGDPRSWGDQPEAFDAILSEHDVTPLPVPPMAAPPAAMLKIVERPPGGWSR